MATVKIALKVSSKQFSKLVNLATRVSGSLLGNASFLTPSPSLAVLNTATVDVVTAQGVCGPKGNRGSHADYTDMLNKAIILHNLLKAEAAYVINTAQLAAGTDTVAMAAIVDTSGFTRALPKSLVGLLEAVQNLRNIRDKSLNSNEFRARWKKPLNTTSPNDVDSYEVWGGTTSVFGAASRIATTSATTYTFSNVSGAPLTQYLWVRPIGAAGPGAVSDVLAVQLGA